MTSDQIDERIEELAGKGWSDPRIGRELGLSRQLVRKRRKRMGIDSGVPPSQRTDLDRIRGDEVYRRAEVYRRTCIGDSAEDIATSLGIPLGIVQRYIGHMPEWWDKHYRRLQQRRIEALDQN